MTFAIVKVLAGTGHAQQRLHPVTVLDALHQLFDRFRLIACRFEIADQSEFIHEGSSLLFLLSDCSYYTMFARTNQGKE